MDSANFSGTLQIDMIALDPTRNAGTFACSRSDFLKPALLCALSETNYNFSFGASASSATADDQHHSASNMKPGPTGRGECNATAAAAACCASSSPVVMMHAPHQQRIVALATRQRCRCCRRRRRRSSRIRRLYDGAAATGEVLAACGGQDAVKTPTANGELGN